MAQQQKYDILKQPTLTLLVTFAALLVMQTMRAIRLPLASEALTESLSPIGVWFDGAMGPTASVVFAVITVVLSSILITRIIGRYSLSVVRSFVPMALLVVCVFGTLYPIESPSMMLAVVLTIHATDLMIMSFKRHERFGEVMKAAFYASLAALLLPDFVYVLALLPIQWFIWQRSVREMIAATITLLTPLLITSCTYWFAGERFGWFAEEWIGHISPITPISFDTLIPKLGGIVGTSLLGLTTLATLASIVVFIGGQGGMRLRARKGHIYFTLLFFVGIAIFLLGTPAAISLPIAGIASVPLLHTLFVRRKGIVSVLLYILLVSLAALSALLPLVQQSSFFKDFL